MRIVGRVPSPDGITTKYLQAISNEITVETTYINRREKHILCFSSQAGCIVGCTFCASGIINRFKQSLSGDELFSQCLNVVAEMDFIAHPKPLLFSCMGEGEPFLNFDACADVLHRLSHLELPVPIRLAISTSGIKPELIRRLGQMGFKVPLKLQVSLHGPTNEIRHQLVPISQPLSEIIAAVREYSETCHRPVDWNYVLCDGINDKPEHAHLLASLLGSGWHVKFNRLNPIAGAPIKPASIEKIKEFQRILEEKGITTEYYETDGADISAACGQLSYHSNQKPTPRS